MRARVFLLSVCIILLMFSLPVTLAAQEDCYADADCNGDGVNLSVADMNYLRIFLTAGGPAPIPLYSADLNGDCMIDYLDYLVYEDFFLNGMPAFAPYGGFPVLTCCEVDTVRGACCTLDGCLILSPDNCLTAAGVYMGDETLCDPDPCDSCAGQYPGDVDNDGFINIHDPVYLVDWLYKGGPEPPILANADPDGSCCIDTSDAEFLLEFIFHGGPPPVECTCVDPPICPDTCDAQYPGDANTDGAVNVIDLVYLVDYLYSDGPPPDPLSNGDVNGDCWIDDCDLDYLKAYIFQGGPAPVECTCVEPGVCECFAADANSDGELNVGDAVYLINHVFKEGPGPTPYYFCSGDANKDCEINVGDAVYLINYAFKGGPRPPCCHEWIDDVTGCGLPIRR